MGKYLDKLLSSIKGNGAKKILEQKSEITIGIQGNLVIMDFKRTIKYLSMDAETAIKMGRALTTRGKECMKKPHKKAG
jgi:hypothetical protein